MRRFSGTFNVNSCISFDRARQSTPLFILVMMKLVGVLLFSWGLVLCRSYESDLTDPKQVRLVLSNNFEGGSLSPWFDESPGNVNWRVEDFGSQSASDSSAPKPIAGTKYVRATRNANLDSGLATLRTEIFTASPGEEITFSFWIRSRRPEGNTLDVTLKLVLFKSI